jgi:hypothetical protein
VWGKDKIPDAIWGLDKIPMVCDGLLHLLIAPSLPTCIPTAQEPENFPTINRMTMTTNLGKDLSDGSLESPVELGKSRLELLVIMVKMKKALAHKEGLLEELRSHLDAVGGAQLAGLPQVGSLWYFSKGIH